MDICEFRNAIFDCTRKINECINSISGDICEKHELTMLQAILLMEIYKYKSVTIGNLAENTCIAGTNVSGMCKKLENMGLLKRVRDKQDERVVKVFLTQKGNEIVLDIDRALDEKIIQNIDDEDEETFDDIINGIKKLSELMQRIAINK